MSRLNSVVVSSHYDVFLLLHPTLNVSILSQTPLIGSARSSVTAKEPISRWPPPSSPSPLLLLPHGPKRRLRPGTRHSCQRISLPPPPLTAQPANLANPPPLKMNVEGLLKWMGERRGGREKIVLMEGKRLLFSRENIVIDLIPSF